MSVYNPRRAPNVSRYIEDLNSNSPSFDLSQPQNQEDFDLENSLAMFTNAEFPDFDVGDPGQDSIPFDSTLEGPNVKGAISSGNDDLDGFSLFNNDLSLPGFSEYGAYSNSLMPSTVPPGYHNGAANIQSPTASSPQPQTLQLNQGHSRGTKKKATGDTTTVAQTGPVSLEEQSRLAAEEDKRRRNTAASARFRIKKKQREKELEQSVKDMRDRNTQLEKRVNYLEEQNKFLRDLITEKTGTKNDNDITEMWQKHRRESEERERVGQDQKNGVGTSKSFVKRESCTTDW